jgi:ParB/RepB/Spo0J family partition protein
MDSMVELVRVSDIVVNGENFRGAFNDNDVRELADSIRQYGLLNPLTVRPVGDGRYKVVAGHRRLAAVKLLENEQVKCTVLELNDTEAMHVQLIENLQRADIHPMDEAQAFDYLIHTAKQDVREISHRIGKNMQYVYKRLKLNDLVPEIQMDLRANWISLSVAMVYASVGKDVQEKAYQEIAYSYDWQTQTRTKEDEYPDSAMETKQRIMREYSNLLKDAKFDLRDTGLHGGACEMCDKNTFANQMLFDDVKLEDARCMDQKCYDFKRNEYLRQIMTKKKVKEAARISDRYYLNDKAKEEMGGAMASSEYVEKKKEDKGCESKEVGIFVDDTEHFGETKKICTDKNCPVHGKILNRNNVGSPAVQKDVDAEYRKALEKIERKQLAQVRKLVFAAMWQMSVLDELMTGLTGKELSAATRIAKIVQIKAHLMAAAVIEKANAQTLENIWRVLIELIPDDESGEVRLHEIERTSGKADRLNPDEEDDKRIMSFVFNIYGQGAIRFVRYFFSGQKKHVYEKVIALEMAIAADITWEHSHKGMHDMYLMRANGYIDVMAIELKVEKEMEGEKAALLEKFVKVHGRQPKLINNEELLIDNDEEEYDMEDEEYLEGEDEDE